MRAEPVRGRASESQRKDSALDMKTGSAGDAQPRPVLLTSTGQRLGGRVSEQPALISTADTQKQREARDP